MQYVALDIETTGLDPQTCQVLQVAAILDELPEKRDVPIETLPRFEALVWYRQVQGEPRALAMNTDLLQTIADHPVPSSRYTEIGYHGREVRLYRDTLELSHDLIHAFTTMSDGRGPPFVAAGRNVAAFDLACMPDEFRKHFHHRAIDVASMALGARPGLWQRNLLPSSEKLLGEPPAHDAFHDARDVVKAIRQLYREHPEVGG